MNPNPTMSIEQFRASGVDTQPLPADYMEHDEDSAMATGGRVYCGCLVIEDTRTWSQQAQDYTRGHPPTGRWYLLINRSEYMDDDLATLEALLYDYALSEQFTV